MTHNENEIDISPMLKDINAVLKGHLTSLLGPIINEKNAIQNILLNMPYVKRLKAEIEVLRRHIFQLKTELETNKKFYGFDVFGKFPESGNNEDKVFSKKHNKLGFGLKKKDLELILKKKKI